MKLKFEIEVNEDVFDSIFENLFNGNKEIILSELFAGKKAVCSEISQKKEPIYHHGSVPIAFGPRSEGHCNLLIIN